MNLRLPLATIVAILATGLAVYCAVQLWPLLLLVFLSVLIAVTLQPILRWTERKGLPRRLGITLVVMLMVSAVMVFVAVLVPAIVSQLTGLMEGWPRTRAQIVAQIPGRGGARAMVSHYLQDPLPGPAGELPRQLFKIGGLAIGTFSQLILVLVLSVYLIVDGSRAWTWFGAFFSIDTQRKLELTRSEVARVISAYVAGQLITSVLVTVVSGVILRLLGVPAALVLAVLAGLFDILPIAGFFLSTIPAAMLALTVSPFAALMVVGSFIAFHAVENYLIVPRIYGDRLRVSTLTVLLSLLAAASLAGVLGAIVVLPIVASYPIVERIWLRRALGPEVIARHAADDDQNQPGLPEQRSA